MIKISEKVEQVMELLGWDPEDDIEIDIGGTVVSGIRQPPDANERWSLQYGQRKYNKDAFLVIKNNSRRDLTKSQPNNE